MSRAKGLLRGAGWLYSVQLVTVLFQFIYAGLTARIVGPSEFGAYAVALAVSSLANLITGGGFSQAVLRMKDLETLKLRSIVAHGLIIGCLGAAITWLTAPWWAFLWGDQAALNSIRILAISTLLAPLVAVGTSLLRRRGDFQRMSIVTLASNVAGMAIGVFAVQIWRSAESLTISAIAAQLFLVIGSWVLTGRTLCGLSSLNHAKGEMKYSSRLTLIKLFDYLIGNVSKLSVSRWIGLPQLGYWNRADMLGTLPFQQIQTALIQVVGPEFRHDIGGNSRTRGLWTDLLSGVAWFIFPVAGVSAILLPILVPLVFGPGWDESAKLVPFLVVAVSVQVVSMVLATAIETLGHFSWMWITSGILLVVQIGAAVSVLFTRDVLVAMYFLIATNIIRHIVQVLFCVKHGFLRLNELGKNYLGAWVLSVLLAVTTYLFIFSLANVSRRWIILALAILIVVSIFWFCLQYGKKLAPFKILVKYGLLSRQTRKAID